jgi:hypothetical protein
MELVWIFVGLVVAIYLIDVLVYWRNDCRACKGKGKFMSPLTKKSNRPCWRCGGSGKRVRWAWFREKG